MNPLTASPSFEIPPRPWSASQASVVIDYLDRSNQSVANFAKEHGVPTHVLYSWRRRLDAERAKEALHTRRPHFVPVRVVGDAEATPVVKGALEVVHPGGFVIRLHGPVDVQQLTAVVRALEQVRC